MTSQSPRKRPTTPSSTLRSTLIRSCTAGVVLASLAATAGRAADSAPVADPLQRLKARSSSVRWNDVRDWSAASSEAPLKDVRNKDVRIKDVRIEVPMPALEKPGLPPITRTIFDQIDSPFGEPEDLTDEASGLTVEPAPLLAAPAEVLESALPLPMPEFLAPQPNPFSIAEQAETFLGEETAVGPAVTLPAAAAFDGSERIDLAQQLPDPTPAEAPAPVPPNPRPVDEPMDEPQDLPELRPLQSISPYYDYFPSGSELYAAGGSSAKDPVEKSLPQEGSLDRVFGGTNFMWTASNLYHNPLYFSDPELERYGHDHGFLQPAASIGRFGLQLVGMPYQLALDPPASHEYALGWYRPQEICTPKKKSRIPFNAKAAATAAGAYTGLIFIFP